MKPGFYISLENIVLSPRVKLQRGDWLVTDGYIIGRFDKDVELDWLPLDWVKGSPIFFDKVLEAKLDPVLMRVSLSRLEEDFHNLILIEPGEPIPDIPAPSLRQLETYLRSRRVLTAFYTYQRP